MEWLRSGAVGHATPRAVEEREAGFGRKVAESLREAFLLLKLGGIMEIRLFVPLRKFFVPGDEEFFCWIGSLTTGEV